MLDALMTEAYARDVARLSVFLDSSAIQGDCYRLRGFTPPALRQGIELWIVDFSEDS